MARGILWAGSDPRMTGCLESRLRDQSLRKPGIRPLLMEPGSVVPSPKLGIQERSGLPPSISLLVARAGKQSSTVIRNQSMLGAEKIKSILNTCLKKLKKIRYTSWFNYNNKVFRFINNIIFSAKHIYATGHHFENQKDFI